MKWILSLALLLVCYGSVGAQQKQKLPVAPKEADYPEIVRKRTVARAVEVVRGAKKRVFKRVKRLRIRIFKRRGCRRIFRRRGC